MTKSVNLFELYDIDGASVSNDWLEREYENMQIKQDVVFNQLKKASRKRLAQVKAKRQNA